VTRSVSLNPIWDQKSDAARRNLDATSAEPHALATRSSLRLFRTMNSALRTFALARESRCQPENIAALNASYRSASRRCVLGLRGPGRDLKTFCRLSAKPSIGLDEHRLCAMARADNRLRVWESEFPTGLTCRVSALTGHLATLRCSCPSKNCPRVCDKLHSRPH